MPGTALVAFILYLALAFGLRSVVQRVRTGSIGYHGFDPDLGSPGWFAGILFVLAFVLLPLSAALDAARMLARLEFMDEPSVRVAGLVLYATGLVGTLAAQFRMGESWRMGVDPEERTALVTQGSFAIVRNPIFTAMLLAFGGMSLLTPNVAALLSFAALLGAVEIQVRVVEEPYLHGTHGALYGDYARRVGRFLPGVGRIAGRESPAGRARAGA